MDLGDDVGAIDVDDLTLRGAQRHVENGALLRDVDLFSLEHGIDAFPQPGFLGKLEEERDGLVGDAMFRVVEENAEGLHAHPLAAPGVRGKQAPQVLVFHACIVAFQRFPRCAVGKWRNGFSHDRASDPV